MEKVRVGAVSYLNTKPLIYGLEKGMMKGSVELLLDYPSRIATALMNDQIDIGLIPVAIIPELKEYHIVSDYCIGATGPVASVCLFSEVPIQEIRTILLDNQSKTSVALLKILIREYWKIDPVFATTDENYQSAIKGTTAGLVIGDRALVQRKISPYIYDLGEAWDNYTQLPFVFASWVSNKILPNDFLQQFNEVNNFGLSHLPEVIKDNPYSIYDLNTYYTKNISYTLDENKKKGLELFLSKLPALIYK